VTSRQYADEAGISPATAVADLNLLSERGEVRREGAGRATRYRHPRDDFQPLD
jgi:Fic family protein